MRRLVNNYSKMMDGLVWIIKVVLAIMLVIMTTVTFVEVIRRYVLGQSFVWAEELTRFLLVGMTFIGGAAAYKIGGMASFDLLIDRISRGRPINRIIIQIIDHATVAAISGYFAVKGFEYTFSPMISRMSSSGLKLNMSIIYITIPIGFVLIVFFAIEYILKTIVEKEEGEDE